MSGKECLYIFVVWLMTPPLQMNPVHTLPTYFFKVYITSFLIT
jgi:hypothetical protein